ncbi:hypothetical protein KIPB_001076 [Kipferlia bialata]|uniref:Uncharacterized protein n=1 Tax=Kipferlia bialata TaxID=797122 RepID=A0A9K3CPS5_9EUKA|nr:hypothetical protein KIPB_001076 [Kipferlia bialata]|eukprot:g1076.t1
MDKAGPPAVFDQSALLAFTQRKKRSGHNASVTKPAFIDDTLRNEDRAARKKVKDDRRAYKESRQREEFEDAANKQGVEDVAIDLLREKRHNLTKAEKQELKAAQKRKLILLGARDAKREQCPLRMWQGMQQAEKKKAKRRDQRAMEMGLTHVVRDSEGKAKIAPMGDMLRNGAYHGHITREDVHQTSTRIAGKYNNRKGPNSRLVAGTRGIKAQEGRWDAKGVLKINPNTISGVKGKGASKGRGRR